MSPILAHPSILAYLSPTLASIVNSNWEVIQLVTVLCFTLSMNLLSSHLRFKENVDADSKIDHYSKGGLKGKEPSALSERDTPAKGDVNHLDDVEFSNMLHKDLTADEQGGCNTRYAWRQLENELEVEVPLLSCSSQTKQVRGKDVNVVFKKGYLRVEVGGVAVIDGKTFATLDFHECSWLLDTYPVVEAREGGCSPNPDDQSATKWQGTQYVWLFLRKAERTEAKRHWPLVFIDGGGDKNVDTDMLADEMIDTNKFGPVIEYLEDRRPAE